MVGGLRGLYFGQGQVRVVLEVQPRRSPLDAAQQQMLDGIEANRAQPQRIEDGPLDFLDRERLQQTQYLHVLPLEPLLSRASSSRRRRAKHSGNCQPISGAA